MKLKNQGITAFTGKEIQDSLVKPHFQITIDQIEKTLVELYDHSLLGRWEFENEDIKYEMLF